MCFENYMKKYYDAFEILRMLFLKTLFGEKLPNFRNTASEIERVRF